MMHRCETSQHLVETLAAALAKQLLSYLRQKGQTEPRTAGAMRRRVAGARQRHTQRFPEARRAEVKTGDHAEPWSGGERG